MKNEETTASASLRLWLQLIKCTKTVEAHIAGEFRRNHGHSLSRFDVLSQLYRFDDWMTVGDLANLMMATGGNITGLLDRMEAEELIARRASPTDRRSYQVKMTADGKKIFKGMAKDHENWVTEKMADLPEKDKEHLIELLINVRREFEPAKETAA